MAIALASTNVAFQESLVWGGIANSKFSRAKVYRDYIGTSVKILKAAGC